MYQKIAVYAKELSDDMIRLRRSFHRIPEAAWEEVETSARIRESLEKIGYQVYEKEYVTEKKTGVIGELKLGAGPVIALRFDIDALPKKECELDEHRPNSLGFASRRDGYMHACGHDGHIAIGLGTARILYELRDVLSGTIRLLFQPAEEGCMGASAIVKNGWLNDVDFFLAGHIVPESYVEVPGQESKEARIEVAVPVKGSLATTKLDVVFRGRAGHGATPEKGISVIPAIASSVLSLNGIPRHSEGATFLNIGIIEAGEGRNILAEQGRMELEVRGETTLLNQYMEDQAIRILKGQAEIYGCTSEIRVRGKAPSIRSDKDLIEKIHEMTVLEYGGSLSAGKDPVIFRASEDAAVMMERVHKQGGKAAFYLFPAKTNASLHQTDYDFDETVLSRAAAILSAAVYRLCMK